MACALNKEQALDLYKDLYADIFERIGKPNQPVFSMDEYMKDLYNDLYDEADPTKALLYVQAVPEILLNVANRQDVRAYFFEKKISLDNALAKAVEFENLKKVEEFVKPDSGLSLEDTLALVKQAVQQSKNVKLKDPEKPITDYVISTAQGGARVTSVNTTTIQFADPRDPDKVSDEERNTINEEKEFMGTILKTVVSLSNDRKSPTDPLILQGTSIMLRPMSFVNIPEKYYTRLDLEFIKTKGTAEDVFLFLADEDGKILFFDKDGLLTDEENGRPVYAGTRKVTEKEGKLWVSNRSNRYYSIVSPQEQVTRMKNKLDQQGIEMSDFSYNNNVATIKEQQDKEINDLFRLRNHVINNPEEVITLPVRGGSLGFVENTFVPLAETEFTEDDLTGYDVIDSGNKPGYSYFTIEKEVAGTTIHSQVYLQRGDITEEIATKIATVLTTQAKLDGEQLDPEARVKYAQVFLSNDVDRNRITIGLEKKEGVEQLVVRLKKSENAIGGKELDLSDPEAAKEAIIKHLMTAVVRGTATFPANVSYNKEYIKSKEYVEYDIVGNKIKARRVNYFNTIKPIIKVEYSKDSFAFFKGMNAYVFFGVPQNIVPADDVVYEIGHLTKQKQEKVERAKKVVVDSGEAKFETTKSPSYADASKKAISSSDATLIFAADFKNPAEVLNKTAKNYVGVELSRKSKTSLTPTKAAVENIVNRLNDVPHGVLNINGNDSTIMYKYGYQQDSVDKYMYNFLKAIVESENLNGPINQIVTTGQSGVSEAIVKAAVKLGIGTRVISPKGYKYRTYSKNENGFRDVVGKAPFMKRFGSKETEKKTPEQKEEEVKEITVDPIAAILSAPKTGTGLNRSKLWGILEVSEKDKKKAEEWWAKSNLSKFIPLERITAIVNSDAFATWTKNGITLYEADGGTSVDLYHEAWHGFSQLYLTQEEKLDLYNAMKKLPKWADAEYEDIEEALAEDFRDYALGKSKPTGIIAKIFAKIKEFLDRMFKGVKSSDVVNPRDIPAVKEYFENLYFNKNLSLQPSVDNIFPEFNKLNSKLRTIRLTREHSRSFSEFDIIESDKVKKMLDGMIAQEFRKYNMTFSGTADVANIAFNPSNREMLYNVLKTRVREMLESETEKLSDITVANLNTETPDEAAEYAQQQKVDFLLKTYENFGEVKDSLEGKQRTGVIAYHQQNSMFSILKRSYLELDDDPTDLEQSTPFKDQTGNIISAKSIATENTLVLISSIYKVSKDSKGNVIVNEDGGIEYEKDEFGIPVLENSDIIWNRLAKILEGSVDPTEMYQRLHKNADVYPEFVQILEMLPAGNVENVFENTNGFKLETNFFQDFSKPRIRYVQLNVAKTILQKAERGEEPGDRKEEIATYKASVIKADFNTSRTINDWKVNFITSTPASNPYVIETDYGVMLNTSKLVSDFSTNGEFKYRRSYDFLAALGIVLDLSSPQIKSIVEDPQFVNTYNIRLIFEIIKLVDAAGKSTKISEIKAAEKFKKDPVDALRKQLPKALSSEEIDVRSRINALATLQQEFSDTQSNFSVLSPENNRVWEHFLHSTASRIVTDISSVDNFFKLVSDGSDPNGRYKHMRWLAFENNTQSKYSVLLNSVFHLDDPLADNYGDRRVNNDLSVQIVSGTQLTVENSAEKDGVSTSNADAISKNLQELNSMLLNGVQEFMRHASKQTSMGLFAKELITYPSKRNKKLYVDVSQFTSYGYGEKHGFTIISKYIAGELERIYRFKKNLDTKDLSKNEKFSNWTGYNREVEKKDGTTVMAGEVFTAFDDVLTEPVKDELYALVDKAISTGVGIDLLDIFDENEKLRERVKKDVANYFNKQTDLNLNKLEQARYIDADLYAEVDNPNLTRKQIDRILVKAYTYNAWIHNFETVILMYGDLAQYNHDKEEFHKRNAGLGGTGKFIRDDLDAIKFVNNSSMFKSYHRKYDGTFNTAIIREKKLDSIYYDEYRKELISDYTKRYAGKPNASKLAEEQADKALKEYKNMKEGDGQGHITLESYRLFKWLEGNWSDEQEQLYKKIKDGKKLTVAEVIEYFPPYKLQYFGPIQTKGLVLNSFHKFSLAPIIPSVTANSNLSKVHQMMMDQGVDYVLFETGSKVGHIGNGDEIYDTDGNINTKAVFTLNPIFAHYLKSQTEINSIYKKKSIFSTQLRKLVLEGLYEKGVIQTTDESEIKNAIVKKYIDDVSDYTELLKKELLEEIGYEEVDGEYKPVSKDSSERVAQLIRDNLTREDVQGDHLIDFIDVNADGSLKFDLSLHPEANKIEKLLLSVINKRIIKQKVKGEPLVQVSGAMYENLFEVPELRKATDEDRRKYMGSNFLPTYHKGKDGKTTAMKVAVALQGDYNNLLKLEYNGEVIGDIDTLNKAIKDDAWMEINRDKVTMVGVRIPVQGLNSMEFMEIYHFLDPSAGNIIIPPAEIVAKSGADFDIDKLTIFMPTINEEGNLPTRMDPSEFNEQIAKNKEEGKSNVGLYASQKAAYENSMIQDIRNILELPENYTSLITPNGTYLVKPIADMLAEYVMDYNPYENMSSDKTNMSAKDKNGKQNKVISPTRVLESQYNLFKHESNVIGKRTLGIGAVQNTLNVLYNSLKIGDTGAILPDTFIHSNEKEPRDSHLYLKHNTVIKDGKEYISIGSRFDADNVNKIADIISQLMNGWVDVEKDAWVFFVQGNYEIAPTLLNLIKTGVPVEEAIFFVSQPLVREYIKEQRLAKSMFADILRRKTKPGLVNYDAATRVIRKYFTSEEAKKLSKNVSRYKEATRLADEYFEDGKKEFSKEEMLDLIKDYKKNPKAASSDLSKVMFLHFLEIEQAFTGLSKLRSVINPDTSTKSDIFQVEQAESSLENIFSETKIDQEIPKTILGDSILKSFFNTQLSLAVARPMFPLRYHPAISKFIMAQDPFELKEDADNFFNGNKELLINTFRNDLISSILQNALRKYTVSDEYKSYTVDKSVPVSLVDKLEHGVYVKMNEDGTATMYVDMQQLEKDFETNDYTVTSKSATSYAKRGLHPLSIATFRNNKNTNKDEFIRFVVEREFLRSQNPFINIQDTTSYEDEYKISAALYPGLSQEKLVRATYERWLANKALDNVFNPYHMFKDKTYSMGVRLSNILNKHKMLLRDYTILSKMKVETNEDQNMFNILVAEKDYDNSKSNLYYEELERLSDPSVVKVKDPQENIEISDFFRKLSLFSFIQSGLNKSKYNFTNVVNYRDFLSIMDGAAAKFIEELNKPTSEIMLANFYKQFLTVNQNREANRYKELANSPETKTTAGKMLNMINTKMDNVFIYDDTAAGAKMYKDTVDANPDKVFIYNISQAHFKKPPVVIPGQGLLKIHAKDMSLGLITGLNSVADGYSSVSEESYPVIMGNFEAIISQIKKLVESGTDVAFSSNGYGDPATMPEKLFVYLSRRLYEEFGYINPGSLKFQEISDIISRQQGISDQDIIQEFEAEEEPFKCKL